MKYIFVIMILSFGLSAQNPAVSSFAGRNALDNHHFWTFENRVDLGVLGALVAADAITTQRGLNEGLREVNPIMRPFVTRGAPGEALGSALGFGAGVGAVYLLHRSHHYRRERMAMRTMVGVEGGFVVNNIIAIR
jgi:hypothetical protein